MGMINDDDLTRSKGPALESHTPDPEDSGYSFAGDNELDSLLSEMEEEKQNFERPPAPEFEEVEEEQEVSPAQKRRSNQTAEFTVKTIDKTIATALSVYAKAKDPAEFYADKEDIQELAKYWGVYFQDNEIELPPWVMASVVTIIVMTKKFTAASSIRKVNLALEREKKRTAELELQIKELTKQKEVSKLEKEVKTLQKENEAS